RRSSPCLRAPARPSATSTRGRPPMSDTRDTDKDLADRLLAPPPPGPDGPLRQAVFGRTARVLRRRRLARRLALGGALAACYLAGLLSAGWLGRPPAPPAPGARARRPGRGGTKSPGDSPERQAAGPARRADLYRQAGDLFATQQGNLQAALRCYSRSLDEGTAADLAISPADHWLLMAIKDARQKEKVYAKNDH